MPALPSGRPRRLAFLGSPATAVPALQAVVDAGYEVAVVVSRADARRGRGSAVGPSPVKAAAERLGLPTSDRPDAVLDAGVDLAVVVAYGRLVKPHLLDAVPFVNVHFSLLPRWRGAAPVERAILAGDDRTGVCIMLLEESLDTGPVYARAELAIGPDETADELRARLVAAGAALLVDTLQRGDWVAAPQVGESTYAAKIDPAEQRIDWHRPAVEVHRVVRAGGAWTTFRGHRLKVHRTRLVAPEPGASILPPGELSGLVVGCGEGAVEVVEVQPEGKGRQAAPAWRNGARPEPAERLGS